MFVGVPVRHYDGDLFPKARLCWKAAKGYAETTGHHQFIQFKAGGASVSQNSLTTIDEFLLKQPDCTHFLYTGDDLTFAPDAVAMLLDADKPVISGCSTRKSPPFHVNAEVDNDKGGRGKVYVTREMVLQGAILPMARVGSGMMLIKREVLEDVRKFWDSYYDCLWQSMPARFRGLAPLPYFPVLYDHKTNLITGTDYTFCEVAKRCGHSIWMHFGVIIGHIWEDQKSVIDHLNWREAHGFSEQERDYPTQKIDFLDRQKTEVVIPKEAPSGTAVA